MFTPRLAVGVTTQEENGARGAVHYRDRIHERIGTLAAHERLHRQPRLAAVETALEHHIGRTGVADAFLARLAKHQHHAGRRQHHRRDAVSVHAVLPSDEDIGHLWLRCFCVERGQRSEQQGALMSTAAFHILSIRFVFMVISAVFLSFSSRSWFADPDPLHLEYRQVCFGTSSSASMPGPPALRQKSQPGQEIGIGGLQIGRGVFRPGVQQHAVAQPERLAGLDDHLAGRALVESLLPEGIDHQRAVVRA